MNHSPSDQTVHNSNEGSPEDDKHSVMVPCLRRNIYDESLSSYTNSSIISQLLRKSAHNKRALDENHFYLSNSTATDSGQEDRSSVSSKDSAAEASSPNCHISTRCNSEGEPPTTDHLQAKRARVENIIRVMAGSPNNRTLADNDRPDVDSRESREAYRENKRKQRLPQHQEHSVGGPVSRKPHNDRDDTDTKDEECHKLKEQLHSMQKLLRQLQEKFIQVYKQESADQDDNTGEAIDGHTVVERNHTGSEDGFEKKRRLIPECDDRIKVVGHPVHQRESQNLREILKQELSRALNDCVDRVLTKASSSGLDLSPQQRTCPSPETQISLSTGKKKRQEGSLHEQPEESTAKPRSLEYYDNSEVHQDQTEALSLVVRKPVTSPLSSVTSAVKRPYPVHQTPFQFNYSAPLHDSQILEHLLKYGPHSNFGGVHCMPHSMDRASPEPVELPWDTLALRSKVTPSHLSHHPRPSALGSVTVDALCLPHVKLECGELQSMAERNPYMTLNIQEGLTPSHLKKAKLMFFYTRYPSSNVLKTFFPDVKFNRCITSQLIKWFSNFREFYYIQMEKFARQAIVDGISEVKDITVSRDSELFRALNMHYNKANDFHVPDKFLEVAEITLHEFYKAISVAKDSDPSWKKAIYKVICKLDSDVPDEFKTSSYL
ncbi:prospero homeobox protein 2 [Corythoichthys intestinalis]|uniref:prospero homeobox protein 2 n=1 Tax=Corythoichthys intestinalis TaxID=161448 RepID=UPI0025A6191C|nr:prospero homeobox protein 2 [Corythoichthys intestinalis]XP_061798897.1 prospero homeobox protein 1-like [Nerophis lumbriciformis]